MEEKQLSEPWTPLSLQERAAKAGNPCDGCHYGKKVCGLCCDLRSLADRRWDVLAKHCEAQGHEHHRLLSTISSEMSKEDASKVRAALLKEQCSSYVMVLGGIVNYCRIAGLTIEALEHDFELEPILGLRDVVIQQRVREALIDLDEYIDEYLQNKMQPHDWVRLAKSPVTTLIEYGGDEDWSKSVWSCYCSMNTEDQFWLRHYAKSLSEKIREVWNQTALDAAGLELHRI